MPLCVAATQERCCFRTYGLYRGAEESKGDTFSIPIVRDTCARKQVVGGGRVGAPTICCRYGIVEDTHFIMKRGKRVRHLPVCLFRTPVESSKTTHFVREQRAARSECAVSQFVNEICV